MKRIPFEDHGPIAVHRLLPAVLLLTLAACGGGDAPAGGTAEVADPAAPAATHETPTEARMEGGVQVVEIAVGPTGYAPASIALRAGVPARLVFTRTVEGDCAEQVESPALGIPKTDLPLNEPHAVEFTPTESGTFGFTCGMGMMEGTVLVGT
ncbi:MAG TPA: cupredoxin domain-containing protein [Rubricoccaceae bacterium]|jgi:plastocyanin|nr:cupredoxin domain-containing protein [Rubricoccaceae bacterium]